MQTSRLNSLFRPLTLHLFHLDLGLLGLQVLDLRLEGVHSLLHRLGLLLDLGVNVTQLEIFTLPEAKGELQDLIGVREVGF